MSNPNASPSSDRGLPELGVDDPNYDPNAPARIDWGEPGVVPVFKPGKVMNVMKGTYKPTEEQKEQAQAHLRHVEGILEEIKTKQEAKKRMSFCSYCGSKLNTELAESFDVDYIFCGNCGEKL